MPRGRLQAVKSASRASSVSTSKNGTASAARQSLPPHLAYPPAIPPAPVSPLVAQLRRDFRWASISQFLCSFGYAVGVSDEEGDVEALEADFDSPAADALLPKLAVNLLYALTSDRKINVDNLETKLRNQYVLRDPKNNPFGTEPEVTRRWDELGLGEKIAALYNCCEWQWVEPSRFRALVDNEEDAVYWRIEPCGWDKTGNTYWLFDDNRLWVQHPDPTPPPPPKPIPEPVIKESIKATTKPNRRGRKAKEEGSSGPAEEGRVGRQRGGKVSGKIALQVSEEESELSELEEEIAEETGRLRKRSRVSTGKAPTVTRFGRVSKTVQDSPSTTSLLQPVSKRIKRLHAITEETPATSRARSTRTSRRSGVIEDQWEPIPEEWLQPAVPDSAKLSNGKRSKKGAERVVRNRCDSDSSELSDLSSDEEQGVPEAGIESDLTSISSATLSEVEDLPEPVDGVQTMVNDIAGTGVPETDRMEVDSATDMVEAAVTQIAQGAVSSGNDVARGLDTAMDVDAPSQPGTSTQDLQKIDPDDPIVIHPVNDTTAQPTPNTASVLAESSGQEDDHAAKASKVHQSLPAAETLAGSHQEVEQPSVTDVTSTQGDAIPIKDAHHDVVLEIANDIASQQSLTAVILPVHRPGDSGPAEKVGLTEEPTGLPEDSEQKPFPIEGKTVLDELSIEIQEALEEEEDDPNDEVRSFIKKARNLDYLEWELVCASRYEWELFPKQFEESRNVDEKAFYRHLVDNILPGVLGAFRASITVCDKEVRQAKEDAVRNRKRSSRLIMNELEREARRKEEETARLMEERMQRVRDEEARQQAEEADRINKEREREDRLREREERIREREERLRYKELEESRPKMEVHRSPRITIPAYANQRSPVLSKALPQPTVSTAGNLLSPPARSDVIPSEDPVPQPSAPTADTTIPIANTEVAVASDANYQHIETAAAQQSMPTM